jgi:peptidylprolyl isomerase
VHFTGKLQDGSMFDTSLNEALRGNQVEFKVKEGDDLLGWDRGNPIMFVVGNGEVIAGWDEGVQGMRVGGIRELIVPPHLGYGEKGAGEAIPPNAVLHFEIELLDVRDASGGGGGLWARVSKLWS